MKKRIISILLTAAMIVGCVAGLELTAGATTDGYVKLIATDGITLDGSLSDWSGVDKQKIQVRQANGGFAESSDEFVQFAASPDSIYIALSLNDDEKTFNGLTRDHVRVGLILPNGEIGLAYFDCDTWAYTRQDNSTAFPAWWANAEDQYNAFIPDNTTSKFVYQDGKVVVEIRACLDDSMRAQLVEGAQIKLCVTYYDGWEINANTYNDCDMKTFGTTANFFGNGQGIDGALVLGDNPEGSSQSAESWASDETYYISMVNTDSVQVDGNLADWSGVEQHKVAVRQNDGSFAEASDEYVQFVVSPDSIYVALTLNDDEKTLNGLTRDHVRVGLILPNGEIGLAYFDCDTWAMVRQDGTNGFPAWWLNAENQYNAFIPANSTSTFAYKDGKVVVELRACLDDSMRAQLVEGAQIKLCVTYYDGWEINANTYNNCDMKTFGTTANFFGNGQGIDGKLVIGEKPEEPVQSALSWETGDAYYIKAVEQNPVMLNGDLSDWEGIEKHNMMDRQANGIFVESEDEFVQFVVSPDSIYVTLTVNDDEKTFNDLTRDHVRLGVILPNGEIGLAYFDCDTWAYTRTDDSTAFPAWWLNGEDQYNAFIPSNTASSFTYKDGKVIIELRACLDDSVRDQIVKDAQIKFCVTYYDGWEINANSYNGCNMTTFGTTSNFFGNGQGIDGKLTVLGDKPAPPVQEEYEYKAISTAGGAEMDIVQGTTTNFDDNFWEWVDDVDGLWSEAEKHPMAAYQKGVYVMSEDQYIQFKYTYGQFYFRIHVKDSDGKTANGLVRDGVFVSIVFPDNKVGSYFFGTDENDTLAWLQWGCEAWFDSSKTDVEYQELSPFTNNNSTVCFCFKDGYADIEFRVTVKDAYRDYFVNGTKFKAAVSYRDSQTVNVTDYEGGSWAVWGTSEPTAMDVDSITGELTFFDPSYRDTESMTALDPTAGAENDGYGFDADGKLIANVKAFAGAVSYRINVFDRWDDALIANTWETSDTTRLIVSGLMSDTDMTYQVLALDASGNTIAVYPKVDFVVGEDPDIGGSGNGNTNNGGGNTENDTGNNNGSTNVKTDDHRPIEIMILIAVLSIAAAVLSGKKRKTRA